MELCKDLLGFTPVKDAEAVKEAIKGIHDINGPMRPLVLVHSSLGFQDGIEVETISFENVRRAHLENGQYPAMNLQDANYDWTILFIRAILD